MNEILDEVLSIRQVNRSFENEKTGEQKLILKDINLNVHRGEFISILGASGCGKTTLLRLIAGLDAVQSGEILLDGKSVKGTDFPKYFDSTVAQDELNRWMEVFYKYRGSLLTGGLCVKEYLDLKRYGNNNCK